MLYLNQMLAKQSTYTLAKNTLHVWTTSLDAEINLPTDEALSVLSTDELTRAKRLQRLEDRLLFTRAHIAVRQTLSRYTLIPAQELSFDIGRYGRPEISNPDAPNGLRFNLSHTPGMIAIVIHCAFNAGVDVERIDRVADLATISRSCFTDAERDALLALPAEEQPLRFAQIWVLKESFIKATGTGLTTSLKSISFDLSVPSSISFNCSPDLEKNPLAWSFNLSQPTRHHVLATAARLNHKKAAIETFSLSNANYFLKSTGSIFKDTGITE